MLAYTVWWGSRARQIRRHTEQAANSEDCVHKERVRAMQGGGGAKSKLESTKETFINID